MKRTKSKATEGDNMRRMREERGETGEWQEWIEERKRETDTMAIGKDDKWGRTAENMNMNMNRKAKGPGMNRTGTRTTKRNGEKHLKL